MLIDRAAARWQVDRASADVARRTAASSTARSDDRLRRADERAEADRATLPPKPPVTPPADVDAFAAAAPKKVNGRDFVTGPSSLTRRTSSRPGMLIRSRASGRTATAARSRQRRRQPARERWPASPSSATATSSASLRRTSVRRRRAASAIRAEWRRPTDHPSSTTILRHLKKTAQPAAGRGRADASPAMRSQARARRAKTFEATYRIPYIAHVPLEPRAAVAEWTDGKLTVWCGTQRPFGVRAELAEAFRMPEDRVRVIVPDTGSGVRRQALRRACRSRRRGWRRRPARRSSWCGRVRRSSRSATAGPAGVIDIKAAVDGDGRLIAWEFDNWNSGASAIRTPYDVPNQRIQFHAARLAAHARARIAGSPRRRTTTRARCTWTRSRARCGSMPSSSGCGI